MNSAVIILFAVLITLLVLEATNQINLINN